MGKEKSKKIHIINSTTYESEVDGKKTEATIDFMPFSEPPPEGKIWHAILGKYVPEDWGNKEMWVDKDETIFGKEDKSDGMKTPDEEILDMVKDYPPWMANAVLDSYGRMSYTVKDALEGFYKALGGTNGEFTADRITDALESLRNACEANPEYEDIYQAAKTEANNRIADAYANGDISVG